MQVAAISRYLHLRTQPLALAVALGYLLGAVPELAASPQSPAMETRVRGQEAAASSRASCSSSHTITFNGIGLYKVRQFGEVTCSGPVRRIRCRAELTDLAQEPSPVVSSLRAQGRRRCRFDSLPSGQLYAVGHPFRAVFRFRIRLNRDNRWGGSSRSVHGCLRTDGR